MTNNSLCYIKEIIALPKFFGIFLVSFLIFLVFCGIFLNPISELTKVELQFKDEICDGVSKCETLFWHNSKDVFKPTKLLNEKFKEISLTRQSSRFCLMSKRFSK